MDHCAPWAILEEDCNKAIITRISFLWLCLNAQLEELQISSLNPLQLLLRISDEWSTCADLPHLLGGHFANGPSLHKSNAIIQARIYNTKRGPVFGFLPAVGFLLWWKSPNDGMECSTGPDWQRRPQALEDRLWPTWRESQRHWHLSCLWVVPRVGGWAGPSGHLHCWGLAGSATGRQPRHQWWDLFDFPMVN